MYVQEVNLKNITSDGIRCQLGGVIKGMGLFFADPQMKLQLKQLLRETENYQELEKKYIFDLFNNYLQQSVGEKNNLFYKNVYHELLKDMQNKNFQYAHNWY